MAWRVVAACVLAPVVAGGPPAHPASAHTAAEPTPALPDGSHVSSRLDKVAVDSADLRAATQALDAVMEARRQHQRELAAATRSLVTLEQRARDLAAAIDRDEGIKDAADRESARLAVRLRRLAVDAYVGADTQDARLAELALDADAVLRARGKTATRAAITSDSHRRYVHELAIARAAGERLDRNRAARRSTVSTIARTTTRRAELTAQITTDVRLQAQREVERRQARAMALVVDTNLPLVALDAYVHASDLVNGQRPGCHMDWSLLAGIGQVESHQGTFGGAHLNPDGNVSRPIYGIALDGSGGNERILATGGGFARAEGPMQFLPSTWAVVAVDGDDDGVRDPQNLYDAAATAASYLCREGRDVATDGGRRAAILAYNFSGAYVAEVEGRAGGYAAALPSLPAP